MAIVNGVTISEAEFTAMQEKGTAYVLMRAFKDNKTFKSPEDIILDNQTKKGLEDIFTLRSQKVFNLAVPLIKRSPEERWITTFYLQHKTLLSEFQSASFTVFNREGGFMKFITDLVKNEFGISKKDSWDPADIWLIKNEDDVKRKIKQALSGPSGTNTLAELNQIMRVMYKNRSLVGISLKLISGNQAKYEEINVDDKYFDKLFSNESVLTISKIRIPLSLKSDKTFTTQDTMLFLKNVKGSDVAKFQIKGNTTSGLSNLKIEGTEIGATAARLGKAPLPLVAKVLQAYGKKFENTNAAFPKTLQEFNRNANKYIQMFKNINKNSLVSTDISSESQFIQNMTAAFSNKQPWIANSKLMQLTFINTILQLSNINQDKLVTDLLYLAQKKGNNVFDFGPFGKLY